MKFKLDSWKKTLPVAILIILVSFLLSSLLSSTKKAQPVIKTEITKTFKKIEVKNQENEINVEATGRVNVYNKIDLFAEVNGVLEKGTKEFRIGNRFKKGDVILKINDSVSRMSVKAAKGSFVKLIATVLPDLQIDFPEDSKLWENYLLDFNIEDEIKPLPEIKNPKERFYLAGNNIYNQYYSIKSQEEMLKKYTLKAPYDGVLSEANLKPGTLVRVGQRAGEFINTDKYEIELSVSSIDLKYLKRGQGVEIKSDDFEETVDGVIDRINNKIDKNTQTVKVFVTSKAKMLKDGMYVRVLIKTKNTTEGIHISRKLLTRENKVFTVEDKILKLKPVKLIKIDGEKVLVSGLKEGTILLGENVPNAFEGMIIN